jgi:hypothetical protein
VLAERRIPRVRVRVRSGKTPTRKITSSRCVGYGAHTSKDLS